MDVDNSGAPGAANRRAADAAVALSQFALVLLTVLDLAAPAAWTVALLALAAAVFIGLEWRRAPLSIRRTSTLLAAAALVLLLFVPDAQAALERGLRIGGLIGSLLLSIATLSRAAQRMALLRRVMGSVLEVPAERRFGTVTVASQFFGGFLGLAGITMMMEAASQAPLDSPREKVDCFGAIARGYAAANLWSPMFSNLSILLAVNAGLAWNRVFPAALCLAAGNVVLALLLQRLGAWRARSSGGAQAQPLGLQVPGDGWWTLLRGAWPVLLGMGCFLVVVLALSHWSRQPVAAVVIVLAPVVAWCLALAGPSARRPGHATRQLLADFLGFRSLVGEVMLFFASGCAGTVIASAIPPAWTAPLAAALTPYPVLACLFLAAGVVLLSCTSVHPMLSGIVLATAFPAASLGLTPVAHVLALLAGLGMAVIMTPFSVLSLMSSRFSGMPLLTVSVRANVGFAALNLLLVALVLGKASAFLPH